MASLFGTLVRQTLKIKFKFRMHCLEAVHLIEPADNDIGVAAIDFNAVAPPSGLFGCDQGRTTPGGDVENEFLRAWSNPERVGDQRRRRAPAVTLRHKGKCSEDAGAEGMGGAGRTIGECVEKPGATGSVRFCSLVAGRVEFHPPTF